MSVSMKQYSYWLILLVVAPSSSILAGSLIGSNGSKAFANQTVGNESATPLSVAPLDHVEYPDNRPAWIDQAVDSDDQIATVVVVSGPSDTMDESLEELLVMQRAAVNAVVVQVTGHQDASAVFSISDEEIGRDLVTRRYGGEVLQGDTPKYEHAVELHFGPELRQAMMAANDKLEVRHRLGAIGVLTVGGLLTLIGSSALLGVTLRRTSQAAPARKA